MFIAAGFNGETSDGLARRTASPRQSKHFRDRIRGPARAGAAPVRDIFSAGYLLRETRGLRSPLITTA